MESIEGLNIPPRNGLHKPGGDREGQWAIGVNDRIMAFAVLALPCYAT